MSRSEARHCGAILLATTAFGCGGSDSSTQPTTGGGTGQGGLLASGGVTGSLVTVSSVTGPYTDKAGTNMMSGGGSLLVQGNATWTAPGHNAVLVTPGTTYNIYHGLDSNHANPVLRVSELVMDAQGWPVSGGP